MVKTILIYLGLVSFTFAHFNLEKNSPILRRVREENTDWQSAAKEQIDLIRSNYPYKTGDKYWLP